MIAIALSGGGNRGPLQVGALQALFERGVWPDFLVGTSAGSLNAVYVAACGDASCTEQLAAIWRSVSRRQVYPGNLLTMVWRLLRGADSLYPSDRFRAIVEENLPSGVRTFADLRLPCYVTASDLLSSRLYLFPDPEDLSAPVVDAVLASAAIPGLHPPVAYDGRELVDGGVVDNVPASVAMDKGAKTIYVVNVGYGGESLAPVSGFTRILARTFNTFMAQSLFIDLDRAAERSDIVLHHIHISAFSDLSLFDFSQVEEQVAAGRTAALAYLDNPQPRSPREVFTDLPGNRMPAPGHLRGAVEYTPSYRWPR